MKNRFGFIPIVLPVLVMVLIIGLINLTGPQTAQAQEANVSNEDARLSALSLTYGTDPNVVQLLSPKFMADRGDYTAMVDYDVTSVTLTATGPLAADGTTENTTDYTVAVSSAGAETGITAGANTITAPTDSDRETAITITVRGNTGTDGEGNNATYTVELTHKKPAISAGSPRLTALALAPAPVTSPGTISLMKTDGGLVGTFSDSNGINSFKASVPFRVQSVLVSYTAGDTSHDVKINRRNEPFGDAHEQTNDAADANRVKLPVGMTPIVVTATSVGGEAKYTIEVTRELPVLDLISVVDSTSAATARFNAATPTGKSFDEHTDNYEIELPFEVTSIAVSATEDADAEANTINTGAGVQRHEILPIDEDTNTAGHQLDFRPGQTRTVTVQVWEDQVDQYSPPDNTDTDDVDERLRRLNTSSRTYTVKVTRGAPKLHSEVAFDSADAGLEIFHDISTEPTGDFVLMPAYAPATTEYTAKVPYNVKRVTVVPRIQAAAGVPAGETPEVVSSIDDSRGDTGFQVNLMPGVERTVTISARVKNAPGVKTDYVIKLTRDKTVLSEEAATPGVALTDTTPGTDSAVEIGLDPVFAGGKNSYTATSTNDTSGVPYHVEEITVTANHVGATSADRNVMFETPSTTTATMTAAIPTATTSLRVGMNTIKVTVDLTDGGNPNTYTVMVERRMPALEHLMVTIDSDGDGDFDADDRSATTSMAMYSDNTAYSESSAQIQVVRPSPGMPGPNGLELMMGGAWMDLHWDTTTTGSEQNVATSPALALSVGANEFKVRVGGMYGATYTVTLTRGQGLSPEINFTLLDSDNTVLGGGAASFMLDASSRQYDFIKRTGLNADILLTAAKVQICVANPDGAGVRVSIEDTEVPLCETGNHLERDLQEGSNQVLFDVTHPGDPDGSLHAVSINRADNSKPVFPANASLRGRDMDSPIVAVAGEAFNPTVVLPFATGGNGRLNYELLSVEADGPSEDLPDGMTGEVMPIGRDTPGQLGMAPRILDASDKAVFNLIFKVTDSDAVTKDDEDTIAFTVVVYRDEDLLPSDTGLDPVAGELIDLVIIGDNKKQQEEDLLTGDQAFTSSDYSYSVVVFTDEQDVDIYALPRTSTSTVALEGNRTNNSTAAPGKTTSGWHAWQGFQLRRGPGVSNTYTITVGDGDVTKRYTVTLMRDPDTAPAFAQRSDTKDFYEGIDLSRIEAGGVSLGEATGGNGALTYTFERSHDLAPANATKFLGLTFGTTTKGGKLTGEPDLDANNPDRRLSDRSEVYADYTAHDSDANMHENDSAMMEVTIRVHRDVTLDYYKVGADKKDMLGKDSMTYKSNGVFSHTEIDAYIYNAPYDADQVTFMASPRDKQSTSTDQEYAVARVTSPADADASEPGHQIDLEKGDNIVTVTVTNGAQGVARHMINIKRPGLQLVTKDGVPGIRITEDQDDRGGFLTAEVELDPEFDRDTLMYTAEVETWVQTVKVYANPADPNARVFVKDFAIPDREEYSVVDLVAGEENVITVGAAVGTDDPELIYTVTVTRKADVAPTFAAEASNYIRQEGVPVDRQPCGEIVLPKAMGGNGAYTYSLLNVEALPPGLTFNPATRMISGTPRLDEGYESDFDLVYAVVDADGNTAVSDRATSEFVITITNDADKLKDDPTCVPDTPDRDTPPNTLSSLVVTYTLDGVEDIPATLTPEFEPTNAGPYSASIPHGATDVEVRANRADDGATISMNTVRIDSGVKLNLPPVATIRVRYPGHSDMTYTLNTMRVPNTAPTFGGATIGDQIFESGMDIDAMTLPAATGGNRTITYTLVDHEGNVPDGLVFDPSSRELSGRPALVQDADSTLYRMTYKATDADGQSAMIMFDITVCDPDRASGCTPTVPEPNPGQTPMDLMVERSSGSTSATITWRPGDDAASQLVAAMDPANPVASINATVATLAGDAGTHTFEGLSADVSYTYLVIGLDANGGYSDPDTASGVSGMAVAE